MNAKEKICITLQASQFTPEQAEFLSAELYGIVAHELADKIVADRDRQGDAGQYSTGMSRAEFLVRPKP